MNARSRLLVGAAILALGAGTLWIAATQSQDDVRYVESILAAPESHRDGHYTLMGIPEPPQVPILGANGTALVANPDFANATRSTIRWQRDGATYFSTHTLAIQPESDGRLKWTFRNETRRTPADPQLAFPLEESTWHHGMGHQAFPVVAFSADAKVHADTPRIWAFYDKAPEHPMQPKPSQFTGRLMTTLPDGTPLPDGALVYDVDTFTAGCSSKFLPPEARDKYDL